MEMAEVVERKFAGDKLKLTVWHDAKKEDVEITLKGPGHLQMTANKYEQRPQYIIVGGLVFQPMDSQLMAAHSLNNLRSRYFYQYFSTDSLYKERPQPVLFTSVLPDSINTYTREFTGQIVDQINGVKIMRLKDVADALTKESEDGFIVVKLLGEGRPIVLDRKDVAAAQKRILDKYNVEESAYIE
jgi:hypothetical protein